MPPKYPGTTECFTYSDGLTRSPSQRQFGNVPAISKKLIKIPGMKIRNVLTKTNSLLYLRYFLDLHIVSGLASKLINP